MPAGSWCLPADVALSKNSFVFDDNNTQEDHHEMNFLLTFLSRCKEVNAFPGKVDLLL